MSKAKTTDFFPAEIKPVRSGVYRTKYFAKDIGVEFIQYAYYDVQRNVWTRGALSAGVAFQYGLQFRVSVCQERSWQGLAERPANLSPMIG
jgi:hypothetical protein